MIVTYIITHIYKNWKVCYTVHTYEYESEGDTMNNKRILLTFILTLAFAFAGCGNRDTATEYIEDNYGNSVNKTAGIQGDYEESYEAGDDGVYFDSATADEADYEANADGTDDIDLDSTVTSKAASTASTINKDMLVYRGNLVLESTDFDKSYDTIKKMITEYDAFVESENLNTTNTYNNLRTYTSSIRVASAKYDDFMSGAGNAGTLKSKNSNAENVSQEYSDTAKALEIYEAKEARYIKQIETIKDETALIQLEDKLTELQIKIAQLKTRKSQIETDVAYSYVNLTLTEVKVIEEGKDSSFAERLKATLHDSASDFLSFLESLLFFLIRALPELIVIFLIIFGIVKFIIFLIKRKKNPAKDKKSRKAKKADAPDNETNKESDNIDK